MSNHNYPITATQPTMTVAGKQALAHLIAAHIQQGLESGAWVRVNGKVVPCAMLHFYENGAIIEIEETCAEIAP